MFKYNLSKISVNNDQVLVNPVQSENLHLNVKNFLLSYEEKIFENLKKNNSITFKIEMITSHPNFIGGILINKLMESQTSDCDLYVIYFIENFGKAWLNSKAKLDDLINQIKKLLLFVNFKNEFKINAIEIYGSSKIKFKIANPGHKKIRYKLI